MGRQPKKCPKKCTNHLFYLKPVHYSAFFSRQSQFCYCPQNLHTQPNVPKFNRDRKAYTAAFILACDQLIIAEKDKIYRIEHERYKNQNYTEKTQIFIPKPKNKESYCTICKQKYQDYQEHIFSVSHKDAIKSCRFENEILRLCQQFGNNLQMPSRVMIPEQLLKSFPPICQKQVPKICSITNSKSSIFDFQQPELLFQKSTKQNTFEGMNICKSTKSFHSFCQGIEGKIENCQDNNFFHSPLMKQFNQNCFLQNYGSFKLTEQTASPIKNRLQRPIILTGKSFTLT